MTTTREWKTQNPCLHCGKSEINHHPCVVARPEYGSAAPAPTRSPTRSSANSGKIPSRTCVTREEWN